MILAAGRGSRLAPLTNDVPKPLLNIGARPLIEHQLGWLAAAGVRRVVINLYHLGTQIESALGDGGRFGVAIQYSREPDLLDTGGALRHASALLGDAPFLLLNGDVWTDYPLRQLPQHLPSDTLGHLVLTPTPAYREHGDFGFLHRRVNRHSRDFVYCAFGVLDLRILGQRQGVFSLREALFDAAARGRLSGEVHRGIWHDIGTPDQLMTVRALHDGH